MALPGHYGGPHFSPYGYAYGAHNFPPDDSWHHAHYYEDADTSSHAYHGHSDGDGEAYPYAPSYATPPYYDGENDLASSYGSSFSDKAVNHVEIPSDVLDQVRSIVETTLRTQQRRLQGLDAPENVVRAAYQRVRQETKMSRRYPDGAVLYNWTDTGQPISAWALGPPLPHDHPWNLLALSQAVRDIHRLRGIGLHNLGTLTTASPVLSPLWGHDIDRVWLPDIIPHSDPPTPSTQPVIAKHNARELEALQWVFDADYGYAHLCALQRDDPDLYALVREVAKAVALCNILRSLMGFCDLTQAWERVLEEKRAARRERF